MITAEVVEGLVEGFLKKRFDHPADTPDFHREMWEMCCSNRKFVAIAAPRAHAKSTAITHAYTLAAVLFRERSFVLIVADTEKQACFFLDDLQKEFLYNEDLIKVFGVKGLEKKAVTDMIVEFNDGHRARIMAYGSGQSLRGAKWDQKRPDLIVGDDLENDEMVENKDRRKAFKRWFVGTLIPCLSKTGVIRIVGTILHIDSLLNGYMPRVGSRSKPCRVTTLAEYSHPSQIWYSVRYRAHDPKMTVALWPAYRPIEWLKQERQSYIEAGTTDMWAREMLNVPFDEENAPFQRRMFATMDEEEHDQTFNWYLSCDFATSEKQKTDYTAFLLAGINCEGTIYVVNMVRERMDSVTILETLMQFIRHYEPNMVFVEKGQIWNMLAPLVTNEMLKTGEFTIIQELPSSIDKRSRTAAIRARMNVGAVKFDKKADWWPDFEEECLRFTGSPNSNIHDDQVDALSLLGIALNKFVEAPTPEEEADEAYEEEQRESGSWEVGRNPWTGY